MTVRAGLGNDFPWWNHAFPGCVASGSYHRNVDSAGNRCPLAKARSRTSERTERAYSWLVKVSKSVCWWSVAVVNDLLGFQSYFIFWAQNTGIVLKQALMRHALADNLRLRVYCVTVEIGTRLLNYTFCQQKTSPQFKYMRYNKSVAAAAHIISIRLIIIWTIAGICVMDDSQFWLRLVFLFAKTKAFTASDFLMGVIPVCHDTLGLDFCLIRSHRKDRQRLSVNVTDRFFN